jgi:hypothetical protein
MRLFSSLTFQFAFISLFTWLIPHAKADVIYTDSAQFEAELPSGFFFNNFSGLAESIGSETAISQDGGIPSVSYIISATGGVGVFEVPDQLTIKSIGNWVSGNNVLVQFTSGNVRWAGANFWLSDIAGTRQAGTVTVTFSNGTVQDATSTTTGAFNFLGLNSSTLLTSMTISTTTSNRFLNFSNFYVAVPEPSSLFLLMAAFPIVLGGRRRRPTPRSES